MTTPLFQMLPKRLLTTLFLTVAAPLFLMAQKITGKVSDIQSGEAIPFVSVFLSNTTFASETDTAGTYQVAGMTPGRYTLAVRLIGYTPYYQSVTLTAGVTTTIDIKLKVNEQELAMVNVLAQRDKVWEKNYQTFLNEFMGTSASARYCKVLNPWMLELEEKGKDLIARANGPLEIENRYLGYKVLYDLRSFRFDGQQTFYSGLTSFLPLLAASEREANQWTQNRAQAFLGSEIHLFKNLVSRQSATAGYEAFVDKPGEDPTSRSRFFYQDQQKKLQAFNLDSLVQAGSSPGTYQIRLPRRFELHSNSSEGAYSIYRDKPCQVAWIETTGRPLVFNEDGLLLNPQEWSVSGYMANRRIAETLPINYLISNTAPKKIRSESDWLETPLFTTDQPYYRPGQNIQLSGMMRYSNPTYVDSLSKLLRVELLHPEKRMVYAAKWVIDEGMFQGSLPLPDTLSTGMYLLRVYTQWMLNQGNQEISQRWVPIIAKDEKPISTVIHGDSTLTIRVSRRESVLEWKLETDPGVALHWLSLSVLDERSTPLVYPEPLENNSLPLSPDADRKHFLMERGITLTGEVVGKKDTPVEDAQVLLVVPRLGLSFTAISGSDGSFRYSNLPIEGTQQIIIKALNGKGKSAGTVKIHLPEQPALPFPDTLPVFPTTPLEEPVRIVYDTDYNAKAIQLNEVGVKAKRTPPPPKIYRQPDYTVQGKDLQNAVGGNFLVALQGRVPGIEIREVRDGDGFIKLVIYVRGNTSAGFRSLSQKQPQPLILVDGVPFEDINQVAALSPSMVERVEVVTRAEPQLGLRGYVGVISIFTKLNGSTSDDTDLNDTPGMKTYSITGYTLPAASKPGSLLWLPNITPDLFGKAEGTLPLLPKGDYRFVVEGYDQQGQLMKTSTVVTID